jgi:hypothetical protein
MQPPIEIPDLGKMDEMQCPDCKRIIGVSIDEEQANGLRIDCRCGRKHEIPPGAVIFGIAGKRGLLTVFLPRSSPRD